MPEVPEVPEVVLLGAGSRVGRAIAAALVADGRSFVAAGPDPTVVRERLGADGLPATVLDGVVASDPEADPAAGAGLLGGPGVVVQADARVGSAVLRRAAAAAVAAGAHHLDVLPDPGHAPALEAELAALAQDAGVSVLPGVGPDLIPGDPLAALAADAVVGPRELHVSFAVPSPGGLRAALTRGGRTAWARTWLEPGPAFDGGQLVTERIGEARRLAWFPRPVGPAHAVGMPGALAWSVPRRVPGVRTVRTYLAMPGWRAELVQLTGNAARSPRVRAWLRRRLDARPAADEATLAEVRWAAVAEARGRDEEVARAWANGHDPVAIAAAAVAVLVGELLDARAPGGVHPPTGVLEAGVLLDRLAARAPLRWSVVRPGAGASGRR